MTHYQDIDARRLNIGVLVLERERAMLDSESLGFEVGFAAMTAVADMALARVHLLERHLGPPLSVESQVRQAMDERAAAAALRPHSGNVDNVVPLTSRRPSGSAA